MESASFRNVTHTINPEQGYQPNHKYVRAWLFTYMNQDDELKAIKEANLADALSMVAEDNGLSVNDVNQIFPLVLRMLKSTSLWAK